MKRAIYTFAVVVTVCAGTMALASPERAWAKGEREALVTCAWSKVPQSSNSLLAKARFDQDYIYDADGAPTVGALMRIFAACKSEKSAYLVDQANHNENIRNFIKRLKSVKPKDALQADSFTDPVFRCEYRFGDQPDSLKPAAIAWGFGRDLSAHQLSLTKTMFGAQQSISAAELDDFKSLSTLLANAQKTGEQAGAFSTYAEGEASKKPFFVSENGKRECRLVAPSGEYENA